MTKKDIDIICWWIPFRKLRDAIRLSLTLLLKQESNQKELLSKIELVEKDKSYYFPPSVDYGIDRINSFYKYIKENSFSTKYLKLTSNLSTNSIDNVNKVIARVSKTVENKFKPFSTFTYEEIKNLNEYFELRQSICKITKNIYAYKNYKLPVNQFEASTFINKNKIDHIKNKNWTKKTIIDVGAYIGDSFIMLNSELKSMGITDLPTIHSFEPDKNNFEALKKTMEMNNIENVIAHNVLLGDTSKIVDFFQLNFVAGLSGVRKLHSPQDSIKTNMIDFDTYASNNKISDIGLIKVDIEGAEQLFLKGAKKTIEKYRPTLLLSIYHNPEDFFEIKPMIEEWDLGYKFTILKPELGQILNETLLIAEVL